MSEPGLFTPEAAVVVDGVVCTWCDAAIGVECSDGNRLGERWTISVPHAQRWRDYWNATHDRSERIMVYPAPWLRESPVKP